MGRTPSALRACSVECKAYLLFTARGSHTQGTPWSSPGITAPFISGHSPLSTTLHSRLWHDLSCHFHFPVCILSSNEWIPFSRCILLQECTSPLHPTFPGCVIYVMRHPQRSEPPSKGLSIRGATALPGRSLWWHCSHCALVFLHCLSLPSPHELLRGRRKVSSSSQCPQHHAWLPGDVWKCLLEKDQTTG